MKIFKFLAIALVAMCGFASCSEDSDFIEYDYSKDLVGTWTYVGDGLSEAMVINADGSFSITGVIYGDCHEDKGTIKVVNNKITLIFEDDEKLEGRLELVAGESMAIVLDEEHDIRATYHYCKEDLSDEIIGMWICNDATAGGEKMMIQTFYETGKCTLTGYLPTGSNVEQVLNNATEYKVIGDLLFITIPADKTGGDKPFHVVDKLIYTPNGTAFGDILTLKTFVEVEDEFLTETFSFLRVKQGLNLTGKTYDYSSAYVTNAKGKDEDFSILGNTFNISKIKSGNLDKMFRAVLSCIELNANSFKYKLLLNGVEIESNDPITVEGNKVTIDMSVANSALRKVEMYMYQDADDSQLHMYMPTQSCINYFANLQIPTLVAEGKLDTTDAAAVAKVFTDMEARIESINVSLVYKARK